MKPKTQEKMFWVMLATINIVAMIYLVSLCVRVGIDDALAAPVKASLGIVLLLVTIDAGTVLVDYRRWREQAEMQAQVRQQIDPPGMSTNTEVIICAAGTALVKYRKTGKIIARHEILCDAPIAILQGGLVDSLPQTASGLGVRLSTARATTHPAHKKEVPATVIKQRVPEATDANRRPAKGLEPAPAETTADPFGAQPASSSELDQNAGGCEIQ